ncbi:MAG TPA: VWA domain-containing protein [Gammaproteobacteria bacterium]|nr:VWA domain-containing protein [Gammaproteobacteria bacterium]
MLIDFFFTLRGAGLPVSITEYLTMLEALKARIVSCSVDDFYFLARASLIKDETQYDKFDRVFGAYFRGIEDLARLMVEKEIPADWLARQAELNLSDEEKAMIESMGGWDKLMEELRKRLEEQRERHQGGNRMIGTAGTSPFGAYGYNPEGIRIGQAGGRNRSAVKVWDKREFRNLDDTVELGTRNIKVALKRLREFAREGTELELDLDDTIRSTARNGGYLDIRMVPERHNRVKVLLFLDVGGSMDEHVRACEELFSAARSELKHMEYFYFHNFIYESVWKDNRRRHSDRIPIARILNTYDRDYKVIVVGDATMSPYEILYAGGSIEHMNEETGATWLKRLLEHFDHVVWLNPEPERRWEHTPSLQITRELMEDRMYPLTIEGLTRAMRALK